MARRRRVTDVQRRRRVGPLMARWRHRLLLDHWSVVFRFTGKLTHEDNAVFADINVLHPYKRAFIQFSRICVDAAPAPELEHAIVHELCHLILVDLKTKSVEIFGDSALGTELHNLIESTTDAVALTALALWNRKPWEPYNDQNLIGGGRA